AATGLRDQHDVHNPKMLPFMFSEASRGMMEGLFLHLDLKDEQRLEQCALEDKLQHEGPRCSPRLHGPFATHVPFQIRPGTHKKHKSLGYQSDSKTT
ncbi:mCG145848, partial [Mus musculus]